MTAAILTILAALVPLLVMVVKRRMAAEDDPKTIKQRNHEQITEEVRRNDADAANARLDKWLRDAGGGDRRGQAGAPGGEGPKTPAGT